MSPGPTFDRVYLALKEQLTCAHFAPGDHLEPATIGEDLSSSITPVRDALHRLVGERMVEAPRNDGFRVPAPTEAELRNLYDWNDALMELALRRRARRESVPQILGTARGPADMAREIRSPAHLFRQIARRSGNAEHEDTIQNLNDRLAAFRIAEGRLFEDLDSELAALCALLEEQDVVGLRRAIAAYHRRRERFAPQLLLAARLPRDQR